jgi:uncharacterized protein (DUF1697 family)
MRTNVAFLRAVNVGGTGKLPMAELKAMLEERGFEEVRTVLQSGSVVFRARGDSAGVGRALTEGLADRFGLTSEVIVRTAKEWRRTVADNPYAKDAADDPARMHVMPLSAPPAAGALDALRAAIKGPETVELKGDTLYAVYPDGMGHSKLTLALIERKLGVKTTARNWNTVQKILALFED